MNSDPVIDNITAWGKADPRIRAVVWTSSRTNPAAAVDALSDYDIILVVDDVAPFAADEEWLHRFGPLLVVYRDPVQYEIDLPSFGRITQYEDGLKIDFTVMPVALWRRRLDQPGVQDDLDVGYRVLIDKDGLTADLPPPTYQAYIPSPPNEATYLTIVEEFFHEGTYVVKNLWRDELIPAKYSFDHVMKTGHLRTMLEWRMEVDHDWAVKLGVLGKGLKKRLPPELWAAFERTYVGADLDENWEAFFATITLFREVAVAVGEALGYAYPYDLDRRATAYFRDVRALSHDATSFRRDVQQEGT